MRSKIPDELRDTKINGFVNAYSLLPSGEPKLFGTETMYGDWNAHTLLFAQDFAPEC